MLMLLLWDLIQGYDNDIKGIIHLKKLRKIQIRQ